MRDGDAAVEGLGGLMQPAADEIAFIGDDTLDIVLFDNVGLSIAVADAHPDVREAAQYITKARGGLGAVREVVDMILASRNQG